MNPKEFEERTGITVTFHSLRGNFELKYILYARTLEIELSTLLEGILNKLVVIKEDKLLENNFPLS